MKFLLLLLLGCFGMPVEARDLKIFLLTGQSNSLGAVKGTPAPPDLLVTYKPEKTMYWHENFGQKEGVFPGASKEWGGVEPAVPTYNGNLCMGPEYGFAVMLEKKGWFHDTDVAIVKASRDGGDNSNWSKNGQGYRLLVEAVKNATAALKDKKYGKIDFAGLLYLQGESDTGASVPASGQRFKELLKHLADDLKPFGATSALAKQFAVVGENANWGSRNVTDALSGNVTGGLQGRDTEVDGKTTWQTMRSLVDSSPNLGYAPTRDLPKLTAGDSAGVHYDGSSQLAIGARFAYAMARVKGLPVGAVRSGRYELPLNSPDAWMSGKVPAREVCVWDMASSIMPSRLSAGEGSFKAFGLRVEDPLVNTVVIACDPSRGDQRLVVGPAGIEVQPDKKLLLAVHVQLAGKQIWKLADGAELVFANPAADGAAAAVMGGADIVIQYAGGASGAKPAIVDFSAIGSQGGEKSRTAPLKANWIIGSGIEVKGAIPGTGKAIFKKGSVYQGETFAEDKQLVLPGS